MCVGNEELHVEVESCPPKWGILFSWFFSKCHVDDERKDYSTAREEVFVSKR